MSDVLTAIVLGLVQGLTEWLPVSSSGHLVLAGHLLGEVSLLFDLALHFGTTLVLIIYFREELSRLLREAPSAVAEGIRDRSLQGLRTRPDHLLVWWVIIVTVLSGLIGVPIAFLLDERWTTSILTVGVGLLITSALLLLGRHRESGTRTLEDLALWEVALLGVVQGIAVFPGISRSGSTISVALGRDVTPVEAGRLSFVMAIPTMVGAGVLSFIKVWRSVTDGQILLVLLGVLLAAAVGFVTLRWLMGVLRGGRDLASFALYTIPVGVLVVLWGIGILG